MPPRPQVSIVLPAYRESENLANLLPRLHRNMRSTGQSYEILVIDTVEPMDNTEAVCRLNDARFIARGPSNVYGDAVRTGINASMGESVVFMDADGSHTPEFVAQMIEAAPGNDVVIASRYVAGGKTLNDWKLVLMSRVLNIAYSVVLGLTCKDVSNSFRLYRGDLLRSLTLSCSNFDIVEEILVRMRAAEGELRYCELPFTFECRVHGQTKRKLLVFASTYLLTMARLLTISLTSKRANRSTLPSSLSVDRNAA